MRRCRSRPADLPISINNRGGLVRFIGLDVHRDFCEVAISKGGKARSAGRIDTSPQALELFASSLAPTDRVVLESTGNALAIARILEPHVAEVVLANPMQVRAICHAKVKNDRFDARTLAELLAVDLIPGVWISDERTRALRRLTSRRAQLVRQRTRVKNETTAVLVRNLKGRPPATDVFGKRGRRWLSELELPVDERDTVDDDPRHRRHDRRDTDRRDRRHPALRIRQAPGRLPRP
ncbi:MAG: transposase [Actinobacteria bacterium]|nr:transposase [Actinomycetota bacterium]